MTSVVIPNAFSLTFAETRFVIMTNVGVEQGNRVSKSSQHLGRK
jgi:hypothetical protein